MDFDTFVGVALLVCGVLCWIGYRYFSENVYIKSKYQRGRYITAPTKKGAKK